MVSTNWRETNISSFAPDISTKSLHFRRLSGARYICPAIWKSLRCTVIRFPACPSFPRMAPPVCWRKPHSARFSSAEASVTPAIRNGSFNLDVYSDVHLSVTIPTYNKSPSKTIARGTAQSPVRRKDFYGERRDRAGGTGSTTECTSREDESWARPHGKHYFCPGAARRPSLHRHEYRARLGRCNPRLRMAVHFARLRAPRCSGLRICERFPRHR